MKIIKAIPNSYLGIKGDGDQEILKQLFTTIAEQERVDRTRLRFLDRTSTEGNLLFTVDYQNSFSTKR